MRAGSGLQRLAEKTTAAWTTRLTKRPNASVSDRAAAAAAALQSHEAKAERGVLRPRAIWGCMLERARPPREAVQLPPEEMQPPPEEMQPHREEVQHATVEQPSERCGCVVRGCTGACAARAPRGGYTAERGHGNGSVRLRREATGPRPREVAANPPHVSSCARAAGPTCRACSRLHALAAQASSSL